jgi:hypothetical protein
VSRWGKLKTVNIDGKEMTIDEFCKSSGMDPRTARTRISRGKSLTDKVVKHSKPSEIKGKRFGRLLAMACVGSDGKGRLVWECVCDCGAVKKVSSSNLTTGVVRSCGCLHSDISSATGLRMRKHERLIIGSELDDVLG